MNKTELLEKIKVLLAEAGIDEVNAKNDIERLYYSGKQNGLLWARIFILELEEK